MKVSENGRYFITRILLVQNSFRIGQAVEAAFGRNGVRKKLFALPSDTLTVLKCEVFGFFYTSNIDF